MAPVARPTTPPLAPPHARRGSAVGFSQRLRRAPSRGIDFPNHLIGSGATEYELSDAERVIGPLPSEYRRFLEDFGWAMFEGTVIWGLGDNFPYVKSFVELTLDERAHYALPDNFVAFANNGSGNIVGFMPQGDPSTRNSIYIHLHETRKLQLLADNSLNILWAASPADRHSSPMFAPKTTPQTTVISSCRWIRWKAALTTIWSADGPDRERTN